MLSLVVYHKRVLDDDLPYQIVTREEAPGDEILQCYIDFLPMSLMANSGKRNELS